MSARDHRYGRRTVARSLASLAAAAGLIALVGCTLPRLIVFPFSRDPAPNAGVPMSGLMLWLEGDNSLELDASGHVNRWNDARGRDRAVVAAFGFKGTPVTAMLPTPTGPMRHTGLRCGDDVARCAYAARDFRPGVPPITVTSTSYSILAVVRRRTGPRFNNYFLMTSGTGCQNSFGGTGCTSNTVLHLGWAWDSVIRHGHYDNDIDTFALRPAEVATLIVAQSGPRGGMDVATLGAASADSAFRSRPDPGPLVGTNLLLVGGTPFFADGPPAPDWFFTGDIFALLIYNRELTLTERRTASDYLRNNYGPR